MKVIERCPHCGGEIVRYKNPEPTADVIIETEDEAGEPAVYLIRRKNFPPGWALPGGFVDYGETVEHAAVREAKEETGLEVELLYLLGVYSDPNRDPRGHRISCVFVAKAVGGTAKAADDAADIRKFPLSALPPDHDIAFDHAKILRDYIKRRSAERQSGHLQP